MKKLLFIAALALSINVSAQYKWPSSNATALTVVTTSTLTPVTVFNNMSYVSAVATLTANCTFSVTANSSLKAGAQLLFVVKTTSLEVVSFGGIVAAPTFTGVAGKTFTQGFIYNGSYFYPTGTKVQID